LAIYYQKLTKLLNQM